MNPRGYAALVAALVCACGTVPDIRFVGDASSEAGDASTNDAGRPDSGPGDATSDAPVVCPDPPPTGGVCCGSVWCVGNCAATQCAECEAKGCSGGDFCCAKVNVQCKAASLPCN